MKNIKNLKELKGMTFQSWSVIKAFIKNGEIYCKCICSCGKEKTMSYKFLKNLKSKICEKKHYYRLKGKVFGDLTVINFSHTTKNFGRSYWHVRCSCGYIFTTTQSALLHKISKRCIYLSRHQENIYENKKRINNWQKLESLLIGKTVGELNIINLSYTSKHGDRFYLCKCSCGNKRVVIEYALLDGKIKNCGSRHQNS